MNLRSVTTKPSHQTLIVDFDQRNTVESEDELRTAITVKKAPDHVRAEIEEALQKQPTIDGLTESMTAQGWLTFCHVFRPDQVLRAVVHIHGTSVGPFQAAHLNIFSDPNKGMSNLRKAKAIEAARNWLQQTVRNKLYLTPGIHTQDRIEL